MKFKQDGRTLFLVPMKVEDIIEFTKVSLFKSDLEWDNPEQGYQRRPEPRFKKLYPYMNRNDRILPTSILLNHRDGIEFNSDTDEITLDSSKKLFLVDGQHRIKGLEYCIEKSKNDPDYQRGIKKFPLPVVIMSGLDNIDEMMQFKIINDTQKKIRTDLVNSILAQISREDEGEELDKGEVERVVLAETTKIVSDKQDSPWKDIILMPNQPKITKKQKRENPSLEHVGIVKATSFQSSIKPVYRFLRDQEQLESDNPQEQSSQIAGIIIEFWKAIEEMNNNTDMFSNPGDYVIQKTPGIFSLHIILKKLLPKMFWEREEWKKDNFISRLEKCGDLYSPSYWDKKGDGAAVFGSMKGFKELADRLSFQIFEME